LQSQALIGIPNSPKSTQSARLRHQRHRRFPPRQLDGPQDEEMRSGKLNPNDTTSSAKKEDTFLVDKGESSSSSGYMLNRSHTLVNPSGWAFATLGLIYLGEAAIVTA